MDNMSVEMSKVTGDMLILIRKLSRLLKENLTTREEATDLQDKCTQADKEYAAHIDHGRKTILDMQTNFALKVGDNIELIKDEMDEIEQDGEYHRLQDMNESLEKWEGMRREMQSVHIDTTSLDQWVAWVTRQAADIQNDEDIIRHAALKSDLERLQPQEEQFVLQLEDEHIKQDKSNSEALSRHCLMHTVLSAEHHALQLRREAIDGQVSRFQIVSSTNQIDYRD